MFLIHRLAAPERHYPTGARPACKDRRVTPAPGGIALARSYFTELVAPTIRRHVPELRYAAARLGSGSEVLGLDDEISRDHDWGLRLQLFVADTDVTRLRSTLEDHLPTEFDGHPVRFGFSSDPAARLRIDVDSVDSAAKQHLGFDPRRDARRLTDRSVGQRRRPARVVAVAVSGPKPEPTATTCDSLRAGRAESRGSRRVDVRWV